LAVPEVQLAAAAVSAHASVGGSTVWSLEAAVVGELDETEEEVVVAVAAAVAVAAVAAVVVAVVVVVVAVAAVAVAARP
jgi:hypothetical protein